MYSWTSCIKAPLLSLSRTHEQLGAKPFAAGSLPLRTNFSTMSDTVSTCDAGDKNNFFSTVHCLSHQANILSDRDSAWVSYWDSVSYQMSTLKIFPPWSSPRQTLSIWQMHQHTFNRQNSLLEDTVELHHVVYEFKRIHPIKLYKGHWVQLYCKTPTTFPLK